MTLSPSSRATAISAVLGITILVAIFVNLVLTPDNYVTSGMFTIAVVLAAYCYTPRSVAVVDAIAIGSYLLTVRAQNDVPSSVWPVGVFGLLVVGLLGMSVAHQREVAARLTREAQQHAQAAETERQRMERLLSLVSHELKGALTPVIGSIQLLQRKGTEKRSERDQRLITKVAEGADRLHRLIADLGETHHLRRGTFQIDPEAMDLIQTVREAVIDVERATGRHVAVDVPARVCGEWDGIRLYQVVRNLVSNAVKYSPEDSEVHVRVQARPKEAVIEVHDRGEGISPADQQRLFEPFLRFSDKSSSQGMGLGLFITKGIVEAHGGRISVESEVGQGTTFIVALPILRESTMIERPAEQRAGIARKALGAVAGQDD